MKALSLWQPWAHAVCHLGKRIENRDRWHEGTPQLAQARRLVGSTILIHAAQSCGTRADFDNAVLVIRSRVTVGPGLAQISAWGDRWVPDPSLPRMALVARATLSAVVRTTSGGHRYAGDGTACDLCGNPACGTCPKADPWAQPGVGLVLAAVVPLPAPIPFKGAQGWFDVPAEACS